MYPLTLIRISKGTRICIEMKNGDTYEGTLIKCDLNMNINLFNVLVTTSNGSWFYAECFVRGSFVKHFRIKNSVMDVQGRIVKRERALNQ